MKFKKLKTNHFAMSKVQNFNLTTQSHLSLVVTATWVHYLAPLDEFAVYNTRISLFRLKHGDSIIRKEEGNDKGSVHVDGSVGVESGEEA